MAEGTQRPRKNPAMGVAFEDWWLGWAQNSELSGLLDPGTGIGGCWDQNNQDEGG